MKSDQYVYGFVRLDLQPVQRIIQFGHACLELGRLIESSGNDPLAHPNFCLFQVADEPELIAVVQALQDAGIKHRAFFETSYDTGYTALATEPISGEARLFFSNYERYVQDA